MKKKPLSYLDESRGKVSYFTKEDLLDRWKSEFAKNKDFEVDFVTEILCEMGTVKVKKDFEVMKQMLLDHIDAFIKDLEVLAKYEE